MDSKFWLRRATIGPQVMVPISEVRFQTLKGARQTLVDVGAFEHRYELLLGNYLDFEEFCARWSLRSEVEMDHRYERWVRVIIDANRHVMNLLSAARAYADHVVRDFKHLSLSPAFKEQASTRLSEACDVSLAYRFFCALRNHVQHRAVPVHGITQNRKGKSPTDSMVVYCSKARLDEEGGFKASVLAEIEDEVDLCACARAYMGALSRVHIDLRESVSASVDEARKATEEAIAEFVSAQDMEEPGTPSIGLTICREVEGKIVEEHPILLSWDDVRLLLAAKNRYAIKL